MHHKDVAEKVETVSMTLGIISGIVAVGAIWAAPTGLRAWGVALGIIDEPMIVTVAPIIGMLATAIGVISGCTYFYSILKSRKERKDTSRVDNNEKVSS